MFSLYVIYRIGNNITMFMKSVFKKSFNITGKDFRDANYNKYIEGLEFKMNVIKLWPY